MFSLSVSIVFIKEISNSYIYLKGITDNLLIDNFRLKCLRKIKFLYNYSRYLINVFNIIIEF